MTPEHRPGMPHRVEREHVGLGPYLLTRLQLPKYGDEDLFKIQGTIPEGGRLILQAHSARYGAEEISPFVTAYERGITRGGIDPTKLEVGIDLVQKMRIRFPPPIGWLDDRSTTSNGIPARIV